MKSDFDSSTCAMTSTYRLLPATYSSGPLRVISRSLAFLPVRWYSYGYGGIRTSEVVLVPVWCYCYQHCFCYAVDALSLCTSTKIIRDYVRYVWRHGNYTALWLYILASVRKTTSGHCSRKPVLIEYLSVGNNASFTTFFIIIIIDHNNRLLSSDVLSIHNS